MPENLNNFYKNVYSQRGEDGIIEEICKRIGLQTGYCMEFGAGDGMSLSNTKNLINKGWSAFMVESSTPLYNICVKRYQDNPKVICLNAAVDCDNNSVDKLIDTYFMRPNILSIDIDGNDYEVLYSINMFFPDLIIVECNPYRYPLDPNYYGYIHDLQESFHAFNIIAREMGYIPICYTQNIFYINEEHYHLFKDTPDTMDMFINGFVKSFHLETDPDEKYRILNRIKDQFGLDNEWLKEIIEEHCK